MSLMEFFNDRQGGMSPEEVDAIIRDPAEFVGVQLMQVANTTVSNMFDALRGLQRMIAILKITDGSEISEIAAVSERWYHKKHLLESCQMIVLAMESYLNAATTEEAPDHFKDSLRQARKWVDEVKEELLRERGGMTGDEPPSGE